MQQDLISVLLIGDVPQEKPEHLQSLFDKGEGVFELTVWPCPETAIKIVEDRRVDVVIMDQVDEAHLIGLVEALSTHYLQPAVIVVADGADESQAILAMKVGAHEFLDKQEIGNGTLPRVVIYAAHRRESQKDQARKQVGLSTEMVSRKGLDRLRAMEEELGSEGLLDAPG